MNIQEKLEAFAKITEKEAEHRRFNILKELDQKIEAEVNERVNIAKKKASETIYEEKQKAAQLKNKEITTASMKAKKSLIRKRLEIEDKVFASVSDKLSAFMATDEYIGYLAKGVNLALSQQGNAVIMLTKRDMDRINDLQSLISNPANVEFRQADTDFIGGFKALIPHKNVIIDNSFASKLEEARRDFNGVKIKR